jgi:hypothetical protein
MCWLAFAIVNLLRMNTHGTLGKLFNKQANTAYVFALILLWMSTTSTFIITWVTSSNAFVVDNSSPISILEENVAIAPAIQFIPGFVANVISNGILVTILHLFTVQKISQLIRTHPDMALLCPLAYHLVFNHPNYIAYRLIW